MLEKICILILCILRKYRKVTLFLNDLRRSWEPGLRRMNLTRAASIVITFTAWSQHFTAPETLSTGGHGPHF